jgi:hypothetical protein
MHQRGFDCAKLVIRTAGYCESGVPKGYSVKGVAALSRTGGWRRTDPTRGPSYEKNERGCAKGAPRFKFNRSN